ncbi:MAG: TonB-dependent receptor [Ottowia sp.]
MNNLKYKACHPFCGQVGGQVSGRLPATPHPFSMLARAVASVCWSASLLGAAHAQQIGTLPTVTISGEAAARLSRPASTGSNLDLTPMETPASVEVIHRGQLEERGDASLVNAITRSTGITSLAHPGNSNSSLSARGFTDASSVMRLYDGTRQYGGVGLSFPFDTWSVNRIEVLRGPASVIYGDGAIGGVVNVIPKKPTRGAIESEVQTTLGSRGRQGLAFGSGGAISKEWSYRVDISGNRSDGWVDRGDSKDLTFNGALQWNPHADLQVKLTHSQGRQNPMRYFGAPLVNGEALEAISGRNYNVADSRIDFRDRWTELSAQWVPSDSVVVRSKLYHIVSHRYWRNAEGYVYNRATGLVDRSGNTEIAHDQEQTGNTTDVSVTSTLWGRKNQVSAGFDINRSTFRHTNNTYVGSSGPVDLYDPAPGSYASDIPFIPRYQNKATQYALFAEDRLELSEKLSLVLGVRSDHTDLSRDDLVANTQAFDRGYRSTGWRIGAVYQVRPETVVYAQFSRAADPVSSLLLLSPANSAFNMATGKQIEVGIKQSFWDQRGEWTLAAYAIQKNNLVTRDVSNPSRSVQVGQRSSRGIESTLSLAVSRHVQLDANVALLRARFDDFTESVGGVAVSRNGNVPTDVPERVANLWASYRFLPEWTLSGGVRYVGKRYADNANTLKLPAYSVFDAALRWQPTPKTGVTLRVFNLADKRYYTTAYYTATQWFVGERRRVELTLNHRF